MKFKQSIKLLLIIFIANIFESFLSPYLIKAFINLPITFLFFSMFLYKSKTNINPFYIFLIGLFVDIISDAPFGLNSALFCLMAYLINSYSNTFKLFSFFQICLFFSVSSFFYVGITQIFMNLENFSYAVLLISLIFNTVLFFTISLLRINVMAIFKT